VVELQGVLVGARGSQRLRQKLVEPVELLGGEVLGTLEPQIPGVAQQALLLLGLGAADGVDRF